MRSRDGRESRPRSRSVPSSRYAKAVPTLPTVSCAGRATASENEWRKSREEATRTRVKIYQINLDRDQEHAAFLSRDALQKFLDRTEVDPSVYDEVFNAYGETEAPLISLNRQGDNVIPTVGTPLPETIVTAEADGERIVLETGAETCVVSGRGLTLGDFEDGFLRVRGEIGSICFAPEEDA